MCPLLHSYTSTTGPDSAPEVITSCSFHKPTHFLYHNSISASQGPCLSMGPISVPNVTTYFPIFTSPKLSRGTTSGPMVTTCTLYHKPIFVPWNPNLWSHGNHMFPLLHAHICPMGPTSGPKVITCSLYYKPIYVPWDQPPIPRSSPVPYTASSYFPLGNILAHICPVGPTSGPMVITLWILIHVYKYSYHILHSLSIIIQDD
jgi:hypothetical protein